jgi:hypothetical protein
MERRLVERSLEDDVFRRSLLADPRATACEHAEMWPGTPGCGMVALLWPAENPAIVER